MPTKYTRCIDCGEPKTTLGQQKSPRCFPCSVTYRKTHKEKHRYYNHCIDCGIEKPRNIYPRCRSCSKKKLWENPEFQEKQAAYRDDPEFIRKQRESHIEIWSDPEKRKRQRQAQLEAWSDPKLLAQHSETLKEAYSDQELYAAVCVKLDEYREQNWQNPEYRAMHSRLMVQRNIEAAIPSRHGRYTLDFTEDLREEVRERDHRKCVLCGKTEEENGKKLDVHHVNYDKHDSSNENLIALCTNCHMRTNHNRKFWMQFLPLHFRQLKHDWQRRVVIAA